MDETQRSPASSFVVSLIGNRTKVQERMKSFYLVDYASNCEGKEIMEESPKNKAESEKRRNDMARVGAATTC